MENEYYVYAIASLKKNYIYVGLTSNIINRIKTHQNKKNKTTKPYAPFCLIFSEEATNRTEARKREKFWKQANSKRKLRLIRNEIFEKCGFDPRIQAGMWFKFIYLKNNIPACRAFRQGHIENIGKNFVLQTL